MSRIRFDQLAKQYLEEFLEPLGTVQRNLEVPGEPKFVDVWFTPAPATTTSTSNLGLLSRIATTPCLLEPFRNAPTRQEIRSCLLKLPNRRSAATITVPRLVVWGIGGR